MIYNMAIVRVYGGFAGKMRITSLTKNTGIVVDDIKKIRHIWDRLRVIGGEFKVYFHYCKEDSESVKEWRDNNDIKERYYN